MLLRLTLLHKSKEVSRLNNLNNKEMRQPQKIKEYEFNNHKFIVESAYNDNGLEDIGSILRRMILSQAQTLKENDYEEQNKR